MVKIELTQEQVKELFDYRDGNLYWKKTVGNGRVQAGTKAGSQCKIKINKQIYYDHILIFFYHHGYLPESIIHVDGNKNNNRIENLKVYDDAARLYFGDFARCNWRYK